MKFFVFIFIIFFLNVRDINAFDPFFVLKDGSDIVKNNKHDENLCNNINLKSDLYLVDLINIAFCNNPQIKESWASFLKAQSNLGSGYGKYLPSIATSTGVSSMNITSENMGMSLNTSGKTTTYSLSMDYLLYDFGTRSSNLEMLKQALIASGYQYNSTIQDIMYVVIDKYYNYLNFKDLLNAKIKSENLAKISYDYSTARNKAGVGNKLEVLQAKSVYSNMKYIRNNVEKAFDMAKYDLLMALGLDYKTQINIKYIDNQKSNDDINKNIDSLVEMAKNKNPYFKSMEANIKVSKARIDSLQSSIYPKFSIKGSENRFEKGTYDYNNGNGVLKYNMIGVNLAIPLFAGFSGLYGIKSAKSEHQMNLARFENAQNELALRVIKAKNDFDLSIENISLTNDFLESAIEAENNAIERYKHGIGNILDVISAQSMLASAEEQNIKAKYDNYLTRSALLRLIGLLENKN